jgi:hypothetical protein
MDPGKSVVRAARLPPNMKPARVVRALPAFATTVERVVLS